MVDDSIRTHLSASQEPSQKASRTSMGLWLMAGLFQVACLVLVIVFLVGCSMRQSRILTPTTQLEPQDFRDPSAPASPESTAIPPRPDDRPHPARVEIRTITEAQARALPADPSVIPSTPRFSDTAAANQRSLPDLASSTPLSPTDLIEVDAKVGDLNGKPILASTWLEPMAARLRAESKGKTPQQWRKLAAKAISDRLIADLSDELYLAEARASLTPEQKTGLRVFLSRFERQLVSSNYGSTTRTEQYLKATQGRSLEEAKREQERTVLIREQLRKVVWNRVQVSMRDIRNAYEQQHDKYHPNPKAVFLLIRIKKDDTDNIEHITKRLTSEPFPQVAKDPANLSKDPLEKELDGPYEHSPLFGPKALQEAAASLSPGHWAGPVQVGSSLYWVYLDHIERVDIPLYDAQLELRAQITSKRREEAARRYLLKLFDRAGIRGLDELIAKLVAIAEQWYYQPNQS